MDSQDTTTTWVFTCDHKLMQVHEHHNTGLGPTENATSLCPSCNIQAAAVNAIKEKDRIDMDALKENYTHLSAEICRLRTSKGQLTFNEKIVDLESQLENLLDSYTQKLLETTEPRTDRITRKFRVDLMARYDDVQWNMNLVVDLETLKIRSLRRNAEYEGCPHKEAGKFHYCDATERTMIPEDEVKCSQLTVLREGVKQARDGLILWTKAYDLKTESSEKFEGAIEDWWKFTLTSLRDAI